MCSNLAWYSIQARVQNQPIVSSSAKLDKIFVICAWQISGYFSGKYLKYLRLIYAQDRFCEKDYTRMYYCLMSISLSLVKSYWICLQGSRLCQQPHKSSRTTGCICIPCQLYVFGLFTLSYLIEEQKVLGLKIDFLSDLCIESGLLTEPQVFLLSSKLMTDSLSNIFNLVKVFRIYLISIILQFQMYNRNWSESPQQRIEAKLKEAQMNRQKAIDTRIKELQRELGEHRGPSAQMQDLSRDFQQFKGKMKGLYTSIFQGSKELSIRKSDLIRQIKGNQIQEYQVY